MSAAYALALLVPLAAASLIGVMGANIETFHTVQRMSRWVPAPLFEPFRESATYAGDALALFALVSLLLWHRLDAAVTGMVAALPAGLLTRGVHVLVPVDRPPHALAAGDLTVLGPALQHGSFPLSGAGSLCSFISQASRLPRPTATSSRS